MKKILSLFLAILMTVALSSTVFAAAKRKIAGVDIRVTTPVAEANPKEVEARDIKILLTGASDEQLEPDVDYTVTSEWTHYSEAMDGDGETATVMTATDTFEAFAEYSLKITIRLTDPDAYDWPESGAFQINPGENTAPAEKAGFSISAGTSIVLNNAAMGKRYICMPKNLNDIAPEVSVQVTGKTEKEYDAEVTELEAVLTKKDDLVSYSYQWKRDGVAVEGATEAKISLKNVSDSGMWHCTVSAWYTADPERKTVESNSLNTTVKILPHAIQLVLDDVEKNQNDPDPDLTYTILGEIYDELEGSAERIAGEDIGKYSITLGTLRFPEEAAENYTVEVTNGIFTIRAPDEITYNPVSRYSDTTRITGYKNSTIRASASSGLLKEGDFLLLELADEDAKSRLASSGEKPILKAFRLSAIDAADRSITMPNGSVIRLQIPLTEAEMAYKADTIAAKMYTADGKVSDLETEVVTVGGVVYIAVQVKSYGTVALYEGDQLPPDVTEDSDPVGDEKDSNDSLLWLWILIIVLTVIAIGAIVFTVVWTGMNRSVPKKTPPTSPQSSSKSSAPKPQTSPRTAARAETTRVMPTPVVPAQDDEDMKIVGEEKDEKKEELRRAARRINVMPPVPDAAPKKEETASPAKENKVVSFEDLED